MINSNEQQYLNLLQEDLTELNKSLDIDNRRLNFINKANLKFDFKFDYSKVNYINNHTKVSIICPIHGKFLQTPMSHLANSFGCKECSLIFKKSTVKGTEKFIEEIQTLHPNLDFSKTLYKGNKKNVIVSCHIHGDFNKKPVHLLRGQGCKECSRKEQIKKLSWDSEYFIQEAKKIHGDKYDYRLVDYKSYHKRVSIICPVHGVFTQTPSKHISSKAGCRVCNKSISKKEKELYDFVTDFYPAYQTYKPKFLKGKHIDIYIPSLNLGIEYNGIAFHHSSKGLSKFLDLHTKQINYHADKYKLCLQNNINLIHVWDFEDLEEWKEILKKYFENPEKFSIVFKNRKRVIMYRNKEFICYGESNVKPK